MSGSALVLSDVRVQPGRRTVLQIDRLEIPAGAFVGLIGPNGAGKTTLLKVCAGLIRPRRGSVVMAGLDLTRLSAWRKCELRRHVGYIPQVTEYNADLPFTLREVVAMGRTGIGPLLKALTPADYEIVDHWIDVLGLGRRRGQTFRSLSGGEQQKALIARAMAQDPRVLMLDEACANLDFHWKHEISDLVERLYHEAKMTVLMVSHEVSVLPPACTRAILLADGRLLADGAVGQILSPQVLQRAYHADLVTVTLGGRTHIIRAGQDAGAGGRS